MIPENRDSRFCVMVPTYNHASTLGQVVSEVLKNGYDVMVVDDGSNDSTQQVLRKLEQEFSFGGAKLYVESYPQNRGKGYAIRLSIRRLNELGYRYGISMDADGQHSVKDILLFIESIDQYPNALIIGSREVKHGNMPKKNRFANRFSNFWFALQTGRSLPDTQSGFRLYPLKKVSQIPFLTTRYEWELEVLVRAAWAQVPLVSIPISVYYPPENERVSHFRPGVDFFRISVLNTFFCVCAFFYFYPLSLIRYFSVKLTK